MDGTEPIITVKGPEAPQQPCKTLQHIHLHIDDAKWKRLYDECYSEALSRIRLALPKSQER